MARKAGLTPQQKLLVAKYFELNLNKQKAAKACGYKGHNQRLARLFEKPAVKAEIERIHKKMEDKFELNRDWVVQRLMRLADSGVALARFKKVNADGSLYWDFTGATPEELGAIYSIQNEIFTNGRGEAAERIRKFKPEVSDPHSSLSTLARILGLFNDKVTVEGNVSFLERINRARQMVEPEPKED